MDTPQQYPIVWLPVPEWEWLYEVSDTGLVRSISRVDRCGTFKKGRILKAYVAPNGYELVGLHYDRLVKTYSVHRLVARAFLGESNLQVNHKDGDKRNNRLDNLEYVTPQQNIKHSVDAGLRKSRRGELGAGAKLNRSQVDEIRHLVTQTVIKRSDIAALYGVSPRTIYDISRNKSWKAE